MCQRTEHSKERLVTSPRSRFDPNESIISSNVTQNAKMESLKEQIQDYA